MSQLSIHKRGLLMTVIGVLVLTPDALLVRLIDTDHWTLTFWRSLFAAISFFTLNACIEKSGPIKAVRDLLKNGLFCAVLFAGSNIFFIVSITHTTVANTLVILASMPFIGAILTVMLTGKNIASRTWVTIVLCMIGIAVVFWGRLGEGTIYGDFNGLLSALFMAGTLVAVNINPKINTLSAVGLGSIFSSLIALFMGATPFAASSTDFAYLFLNGAIVFPIAMSLITYGPKLISAPEVSLIMLLETVLGPLWVWLVLSEEPPLQTFIGGVIVITAVLINAVLGFKTNNQDIV